MSAQGEKNTLLKPGETPGVSEKTESEISEEKDPVKEEEKADIGISDQDKLLLSYFALTDLAS